MAESTSQEKSNLENLEKDEAESKDDTLLDKSEKEGEEVVNTGECNEEQQESSEEGLLGMNEVSKWGSWFSQSLHQIVGNVKDKSVLAYDYVKKDLAEFTQETSKTISGATQAVQERIKNESQGERAQQLKSGLSTAFQAVSRVMYIPPDDSSDEAMEFCSPAYDVHRQSVKLLRMDCASYLPPSDEQSQFYEAWKKTYCIDDQQEKIAHLLAESPEVKKIYSELVPVKVSHDDFFTSYFFHLGLLEQEQARKMDLAANAAICKESLDWDDIGSSDRLRKKSSSENIVSTDSCSENKSVEVLRVKEKEGMVIVSAGEDDEKDRSSSGESGKARGEASSDDWEKW